MLVEMDEEAPEVTNEDKEIEAIESTTPSGSKEQVDKPPK
jgi:hypothetical protein